MRFRKPASLRTTESSSGRTEATTSAISDKREEACVIGGVSIRRDLKIRGYVVGQFPNPPLWIALAALVVAGLTDDGSTIDNLARAISYVALAVWAYGEAAHGVNGFRKVLGTLALGLIVVSVARAIG
jgi:hypothetical protein